jgi:chemotaxis protein histidine kinase CheA
MKFRTDESFLFPASQLDFKRDHILFPQGGLHGFGRISDENIPYVTTKFGAQNLYLNADQVAAALSQYPDTPVDANGDLLRSNWIRFYISKVFPNPTTDYDKRARAEYEQIIADLVAYEQTPQAKALIASASSTAAAQDRAYYEASEARAIQENAARAAAEAAAAEAARQAAAAAAATAAQAAAAQAAAEAAAAAALAARPVSFSLDVDSEGTMILVGKRADGSSLIVMRGADNIDAYLVRNTKQTRFDLAQTAAYVREAKRIADAATTATNTQKTAVDTSTGTVKTVDTASGTTSTVNTSTGRVTLTNTAGQTVTGTGTVTAGGVTTKVDTTTGVVTTQNANTGVATQTNAGTGQTVTAVQTTGTAATGGTFILPDGKTITTTEPITGGGLDAGKIALVGLVGLLLLRGAIK